jgi:hypothetical protein
MLFREVPPLTTVLEVLSMLNVPNEFPCTFQKDNLKKENFITCAGILEPYYLPCKARLYLDHTDDLRWITIIRHILAPHGYGITSLETTRNKKKAIFYTIERTSGVLKAPITIDLS